MPPELLRVFVVSVTGLTVFRGFLRFALVRKTLTTRPVSTGLGLALEQDGHNSSQRPLNSAFLLEAVRRVRLGLHPRPLTGPQRLLEHTAQSFRLKYSETSIAVSNSSHDLCGLGHLNQFDLLYHDQIDI